MRRHLARSVIASLLLSVVAVGQGNSVEPVAVFDRAVADFEAGRVVESARGFDTLAKLVPRLAPDLWQRGIALYYAGRYQDCREQFERHRTVNPNDVENAVWHFLCVAKQESAERARAVMLPVGPDPRVPMREIADLFRGTLTPADVFAAAGADPGAQFYAELYVGLYYEATGNRALALTHITRAAAPRFALLGIYMYVVAKVHVGLQASGASRPAP